jgi:hypothetical protein
LVTLVPSGVRGGWKWKWEVIGTFGKPWEFGGFSGWSRGISHIVRSMVELELVSDVAFHKRRRLPRIPVDISLPRITLSCCRVNFCQRHDDVER